MVAILRAVICSLVFVGHQAWGWGKLRKSTTLIPSSSQSSRGGTYNALGRSAQGARRGLQTPARVISQGCFLELMPGAAGIKESAPGIGR